MAGKGYGKITGKAGSKLKLTPAKKANFKDTRKKAPVVKAVRSPSKPKSERKGLVENKGGLVARHMAPRKKAAAKKKAAPKRR